MAINKTHMISDSDIISHITAQVASSNFSWVVTLGGVNVASWGQEMAAHSHPLELWRGNCFLGKGLRTLHYLVWTPLKPWLTCRRSRQGFFNSSVQRLYKIPQSIGTCAKGLRCLAHPMMLSLGVLPIVYSLSIQEENCWCSSYQNQ